MRTSTLNQPQPPVAAMSKNAVMPSSASYFESCSGRSSRPNQWLPPLVLAALVSPRRGGHYRRGAVRGGVWQDG
ncbi:hypothetical protein VTK26DRAFT_6213 [Humicola hyalothermophila]